MIDQSLAQPAPTTTPDLEHVGPIAARVLRGLVLYQEHASEIRFEGGVWLVPSQHDATSVYEVSIGRKGESCECRDFEHRGEACKHIVAATIAKAKTAACCGCSQRLPRRELVVEAMEDDLLGVFEGERYCRPCARRHGVL